MHVDHLRHVIGIEDRETERLLEHRDQIAGVDEGRSTWAYARGSTRAPGTKTKPVVGLIATPALSFLTATISYQVSR